MRKLPLLLSVLLSACSSNTVDNAASNNDKDQPAATLSLTRLDCGSMTIKNFDKFFSDKPGLYETAPREITDSCYLIRHGDQLLLWDTGLSADLKDTSFDAGDLVMRLKATLVEQLAQLGVKPEDVDIVGISHHHADHTGQAAAFPGARLLIGDADLNEARKPGPPDGKIAVTPWLKDGPNVQRVRSDVDIFGDGSVIALHLPGHTPDHLALLVNLKSGPVLLSGDLYHSRDAREKRGVPSFNASREQTLKSMDAFEAKAKATGAKVVIQHEPRDIAKLPAFPKAAE